MPWGCWVELKDKDVHCKEWECIIENLTDEEADTTVHRIYGQRATLSVIYKPGDWDSVRAWILTAGSGWHQADTAQDLQSMNKFAAGSLGAFTAHRIKWILSGRSAVEQMRQWQQALQQDKLSQIYEVATISRFLTMIGLFCKRDYILQKRPVILSRLWTLAQEGLPTISVSNH